MNKELEKQACEYFACPNISIIDDFCDNYPEHQAIEDIRKRAKTCAKVFFKKTYHNPPTSYLWSLAACIYIASILECSRFSQKFIAEYFEISAVTVAKYAKTIVDVCDIELME